MMRAPRRSIVAVVALLSALGCSRVARRQARSSSALPVASAPAPLVNDSPFAPSFARISHGPSTPARIEAEHLDGATECARCHADVAAQYAHSVHRRSSLGNRFYAASVDLTRKHRGNEASRWCGGCHDPALLLTGATATSVAPKLDRADVQRDAHASDGIGCLLCHSMQQAARTGGGGYTLAPATFVAPRDGDRASIDAHKRQMRPNALGTPEGCGVCHKVSIDGVINGKRWYRGQNDFDGWEQGPYALGGAHTAGEIYAPEIAKRSCIDCHMPEEQAGPNERAARGEARVVKSHRFSAANTGLATFVGDDEALAHERSMLRGAVRVELAGVRVDQASRADAPTDASLAVPVRGEQTLTLDVVVENTRVGHRFPTGTADSNEIWLALDVRDAEGNPVASSGEGVAEGAALDAEAHRFGVLQLDAEGKPALFRDAHRFAAIGWDTTIAPRDAQVVRYAFRVPAATPRPLRVRSRVLYRKFTPALTALACATEAASGPAKLPCPALPIVEVSRDEVTLGQPRSGELAGAASEAQSSLAYARGLLNALQENVGDAEPVIDRLAALLPDSPAPLIERARLSIRQGRTDEAVAALDRAALLDRETPVIPYLRGLAAYQVYRLGTAVEPLRLAVARAPTSLMARELLGEALELAADDRGAWSVVREGLAIDPESAQLHHLAALAFDRLGRPEDAATERAAYLRYRRDDDAPAIRSRCKAKVEGCAREAAALHTHWLRFAGAPVDGKAAPTQRVAAGTAGDHERLPRREGQLP
jgi:tetratricopeptide (TPR) repeat protein